MAPPLDPDIADVAPTDPELTVYDGRARRDLFEHSRR